MENNALYSKSLVLPVTRFVSEMLLELRSSGYLLRSQRFRLEWVRQWASARERVVKQYPEPAVSSWSFLHVITLFSVLSTNRAINTNVLGELSSAKQ